MILVSQLGRGSAKLGSEGSFYVFIVFLFRFMSGNLFGFKAEIMYRIGDFHIRT